MDDIRGRAPTSDPLVSAPHASRRSPASS